MTLYEYLDSKIPDYYPTMYRDGYSPEQIIHAAHRKIIRDHEAREAAKREAAEANEIPEVKITSKVVIKKLELITPKTRTKRRRKSVSSPFSKKR